MIAHSFKNITAEDAANFLTCNALNLFFLERLTIPDSTMLFKVAQQDPVTDAVRHLAEQPQDPYAFPHQITAAWLFNDQRMCNNAC